MPYCNKKIISFLLTSRCNMACKYCYGARKADYNKLDLDFAKCGVDEYVATGAVNGIRFFGNGEPTTEPQLIKDICEYARKFRKNINCEIQTNGYFGEELAEWLAYNMDEIWVSMDLLPDTHDMFRVTRGGKPTSGVIERNLKYFKSLADKRAMVGVRSTITQYNIDRQKEGIDYLANLGIKYIWVDPIFPPVSEAEDKTFEPIDMMHFARTFIDAREHGKELGVFYETNLTTNFDGPTCYNCRSCLPMPHLTMDGYVSACEMCMSGANPEGLDAFVYGKYDKEHNKIIYDEKKIAVLQSRTLDNLKDCRDCIAREHCAGFCLGETLNENGDLFKIKRVICEPLRYLYAKIGNDYARFGGEFKYKHP